MRGITSELGLATEVLAASCLVSPSPRSSCDSRGLILSLPLVPRKRRMDEDEVEVLCCWCWITSFCWPEEMEGIGLLWKDIIASATNCSTGPEAPRVPLRAEVEEEEGD